MINKSYGLREASQCYNKEQGKGRGRLGKEIEILNRIVREESAEKATFEPRWEEIEKDKLYRCSAGDRSLPGRRNDVPGTF